MKRRVFLPLILLVLLLSAALVAGCAATGSVSSESASTAASGTGGATGRTAATTTDASPNPEATVGIASTTEQAEAPQEQTSSEPSGVEEAPVEPSPAQSSASQPSPASFGADPRARGGAGYGADSILEVRYGLHEGYERVVVDLGAGERPAGSVPEWVLSSPTGDGILRVGLPSVSTTRVSNGSFGGPLLENFYVVRSPDGGMFVDIFADSAFTYRVMELLNPARVVVDFKPSEAALEVPLPAEGGNTVLVQPRRGERVGDSLIISGYSRNPEASNTIILTDGSGRELVRDTVMSNDWTSTWGYFETTLDLPSFEGRATLKVGAPSARDGSFEGVETPVYRSG